MDNSPDPVIHVFYPAPISDELAEQLLNLAEQFGGCWSGSGAGMVRELPDRNIEFHFPDQVAAQRFVEACQLLAIVKIQAIGAE